MRHTLASLLFIPLVMACSMNAPSDATGGGSAGSTAPTGAGPITVRLTQRAPTEADATPSATGGAGTVAVRGSLSTPTPCYDLSGTAAREGSTITLTVAAKSREGMCVQTIGSLAYEATLSGVAAGAYTVNVVHTYPGTGWDTQTAHTQSVQVR